MSDFRQGNAMKKIVGVFITMAVLSLAAHAQERGHLNVQTVVQKEEVIVNDAGETETRLVAADIVVPGERVVYTITFRNVGEEPADNVVITNPIDDSLTYVDGSAFGPGMDIQFSVDGGVVFAPADDLTVTEDGVERPAVAADFTHVRWVMQNELAVGAQGTARFTTVLD
ncbi:MAG: DUF11 domain-containing protein [Proteobacteria bacterium]|nr:DUF11 domain-containing protein [Pseudomonadota bacterium]